MLIKVKRMSVRGCHGVREKERNGVIYISENDLIGWARVEHAPFLIRTIVTATPITQ
jgi:hypothetical protein